MVNFVLQDFSLWKLYNRPIIPATEMDQDNQ
jgi:hypothetical protein